jgi:hypothetical protein
MPAAAALQAERPCELALHTGAPPHALPASAPQPCPPPPSARGRIAPRARSPMPQVKACSPAHRPAREEAWNVRPAREDACPRSRRWPVPQPAAPAAGSCGSTGAVAGSARPTLQDCLGRQKAAAAGSCVARAQAYPDGVVKCDAPVAVDGRLSCPRCQRAPPFHRAVACRTDGSLPSRSRMAARAPHAATACFCLATKTADAPARRHAHWCSHPLATLGQDAAAPPSVPAPTSRHYVGAQMKATAAAERRTA